MPADGKSAFEDFICALGGLHSKRVRQLLHWVHQQQAEAAETGKVEWEQYVQQHLKEVQEVRKEEDQKRSDRLARNKEELQALEQRIEQLEEQIASRIQFAIPPDASVPAPQTLPHTVASPPPATAPALPAQPISSGVSQPSKAAGCSVGSHHTPAAASDHDCAGRLGSWDLDLTVTAVNDALGGYHNRRAKELMRIVQEQVVTEEWERRRRPHLERAAKRKIEVDKIHSLIRLQEKVVQILRKRVTQLEKQLAAATPDVPSPASQASSKDEASRCIATHVLALEPVLSKDPTPVAEPACAKGTVRCQTDGICSQLQLSTLDVRVLARTPQRSVSVDVERFNDGTQLRVSVTTEGDKLDPLCGLFERSAITLTQCVIFTHTQDKVTWLTREMCARGHTMRAIHTETDLATILREFSSSGVLITTNDLARGFGGQQVSVVINYDLPCKVDEYLQRTDLAKSVVISFVTPDDQVLQEIQGIEDLPSDMNPLRERPHLSTTHTGTEPQPQQAHRLPPAPV